MKPFLKYQTKINILFSVIITAFVFYSSILGQRISKIDTNFIIDTGTINNIFITLSVATGSQNSELIKKTMDQLNREVKQLNEKWDKMENEIKIKESIKSWVDLIIFILITLQLLFNVFISEKREL